LAVGFLPVTAAWWGWAVAVKHLLFFVAVSWMLAELLMLRFPKIPFTCPYMPGRANIIFVWTAYALAFLMFTYSFAGYEREMLGDPAKFAEFATCTLVFAGVVVAHRKHLLRKGILPVFQEQSSIAYQRLNLLP
jgi:hypothetical protein